MPPVPAAPTIAAILTRLEGTTVTIGDGRKPADTGWSADAGGAFTPYAVLHVLTTQRHGPDAPLSDRNAAPVHTFQVSSVGATREQADTVADIAANALLSHPLEIRDRTPVLLIHEGSIGAQPDESVNPPVFLAVDRFRLDT